MFYGQDVFTRKRFSRISSGSRGGNITIYYLKFNVVSYNVRRLLLKLLHRDRFTTSDFYQGNNLVHM